MIDFITEKISSWEKIKNSGLPVVIYGMGNGADKVIDEFERLEIPIMGVTASDDFVRGQFFRGFIVKKLSEFDGEFILVIAFATCIPEVMEKIYSLKEKYTVIVPCVPVFGDEIFNRDFIEKNETKLKKAYDLFDAESKEIFAGCVNFMFSGDLDILKSVTTDKDEIFTGEFSMGVNEGFLDLGAYKGDTVEEFLRYSGEKYSEIIALEPDRRTYKKLCDYLENIPDSVAIQKAVFSESKTAIFSSKAGRQSTLSQKGEEIQTTTVDELCDGKNITYIKMDVEGAEYEALEGAKETLKNKKPKLNIALYHRSKDIFELPLKISEINPEYKFYIRRHPYIPCWDMNLYCV